MNYPFKLPVLLACPKCLFIFSAPGVGIDIRPLKSSEQPNTSPDFRATGTNLIRKHEQAQKMAAIWREKEKV